MPTRPPFRTADLCDAHPDLAVAEGSFRAYGRPPSFAGAVRTVVAPDDNSLVRAALAEPGRGAVLVIQGFGSRKCALVGDQLGALAVENGWAGIVVNGCIRDATLLDDLELGLRALGTCPRKSEKRGRGERDVAVAFAGLEFRPGRFLYADRDGIVLSERDLLAPTG